MRLLVDEDLRSGELMARLRKAGHHVETLRVGTRDQDIWPHAQEHALIVLTANPDDLRAQAAHSPDHHGLLLVDGERDARKQMSDAQIVAAIGFVREVRGETLRGQQVSLNEWRGTRDEQPAAQRRAKPDAPEPTSRVR